MKKRTRYQAAALALALLLGSFSAYAAGDPLRYQQWALHNDGSFAAEEQYAVYQDTEGFGITDAVTAGIDINLAAARESYRAARPVIVALIDTGADISHPELTDALWSNPGEIAGNGIDDDGNGYVDDIHGWNFIAGTGELYSGSEDNHGTHCAGTIAAAAGNDIGIEGIAAGAPVRLMPLKVLGSGSSGSPADVAEAIRYAEANGAVICNLSIGTDKLDAPLYKAMNESSMLFVVAAGNRGADSDKYPIYPAAFDLSNVISVANLRPDGTLLPLSNYGSASVDIAAPGTQILSTVSGGGYGYMTGTSMAAPMVSAAAALVYSHYADASPADIKRILLDSARPLESLAGMTVSGGMLDIGAALSGEREPPDEPPTEPVFTDIAGHWAERDILKMAERGLWSGTGNGMFSPQGAVSRAMFVTVLWRLAGSPEPADAPEFSDVADSEAYYYKAVAWAAESGVTEGYDDGSFRPGVPVTRQQLAALLFRCAELYGADTAARGVLTAYADWHSFQTWAFEPCAWAVGCGLMIGRSADSWAPNGTATRAEAAAIISRFAAMSEQG